MLVQQKGALLDRLNARLTLGHGTWLHVRGVPGAGKTTFLNQVFERLLSLQPTSQKILRLTSRPLLIEGSILQNILLGDAQLSLERAVRQWDALCTAGGGAAINSERAAMALSAGEKQLLSLARVLIRQPWVLILDEATNSLNDVLTAAVWRMLKTGLPDTTVLVASHQRLPDGLFDATLPIQPIPDSS